MKKQRGYGVAPALTKEYLLRVIGQEEIFKRYTNFDRIETVKLFRSPIRDDDNPTAKYAYRADGKLVLRDFNGHFWGDCFDLVQKMEYCSNFQATLERIALDFGIIRNDGTFNENKVHVPRNTPKVILQPTQKQIRVKRRPWKEVDKVYWSDERKFTKAELVEAKIAPVDVVWLNDYAIYSFAESGEKDPAYVYQFGEGYNYKIYFPKRVKKMRFLCNTDIVQNYEFMPEHVPILILTKSYKDCRQIIKHYDTHGTWAIAAQAESHYFTESQLFEYRERCDYLVSLYDFDYAGIRMANWLKNYHQVLPLFFTNGRFGSYNYGFKDFDEGVIKYGHKHMSNLIWKAKAQLSTLFENGASPFWTT